MIRLRYFIEFLFTYRMTKLMDKTIEQINEMKIVDLLVDSNHDLLKVGDDFVEVAIAVCLKLLFKKIDFDTT